MKKAFWTTDWFTGLAISLVFFIAWLAALPFLQGMERNAYDLGVRLASRTPDATQAEVAVIAIDDQSIENIGRWPWSREVHADMVDRLTSAGAKVIGLNVFYSEEQVDPGLTYIRRIREQLDQGDYSAVDLSAVNLTLEEAEANLDTDAVLAASLENSTRVILPMQFVPGEVLGNPDDELPDYVTRFALPEDNVIDIEGLAGVTTFDAVKASSPVARIGSAAAGIGHLVNPIDLDGGLRREILMVRYFDRFFPSQALLIAAAALNTGVEDITAVIGESVQLANLTIETDVSMAMLTSYYSDKDDGRPAFDVDSFYDVRYENIPIEKYKDKIVLIGPTAFGLGQSIITPVGDLGGPVLAMAHAITSILSQQFFIQPGWAGMVEFLVMLLIAAYLIVLLPRLKAAPAFIISAALLVVLLGVELGLMASSAMWLQLVTPCVLLAVGHLLLTTKRFMFTEAAKHRVDVESNVNNRQLAMQYQQAGNLDMAFDAFRRCEVDEALLDNLYSLASEFERKRQFNKAYNVYSYIGSKDPNFRDVQEKTKRAKALEETVLIGGASSGGPGTSILADGSIEKPTLGKFEIEKELGKGAMGIVYLGHDPVIDRKVAIKTLALAQEFEADELDEVKMRFFREAQTAGRLEHENIVKIYDVGEEHDLAFIAMELLKGDDLTPYVKPDNLLPLPTVMGIIFRSAMALDHAHKQNIVHRDIKPANIMYDPETKKVKLTDFGIARITDSSKTKTGMVLGTPSYMSPEQLSGKKVDGRSDLFSLGVTFYQMLTGRLPFKGDSMATLMYKIANEAHEGIDVVRPDLVKQRPCVSAIIDRALQKTVEDRYQSGADMARDLQQCAKEVAVTGPTSSQPPWPGT